MRENKFLVESEIGGKKFKFLINLTVLSLIANNENVFINFIICVYLMECAIKNDSSWHKTVLYL